MNVSDPCNCCEVHAIRAEIETTRAARDEFELRALAAERLNKVVVERLDFLMGKLDGVLALAGVAPDEAKVTDVG